MGIQTRTYLKGRFETGDKPTQQDFYDLLDSFVHSTDDPSKALPAVSGQAGKILKTDGTNVAWSAESPFPEAPVDGSLYARKDAGWSVITDQDVPFPEAPIDGTSYARKDGAWSTITASIANLTDIPNLSNAVQFTIGSGAGFQINSDNPLSLVPYVGRCLHLDHADPVTLTIDGMSSGETITIANHDSAKLNGSLTLVPLSPTTNINGKSSLVLPPNAIVMITFFSNATTSDYSVIAANSIDLMPMDNIHNVMATQVTSSSNYVYTDGNLTSYNEVRGGVTYTIENFYDTGKLSYTTIVGGALPKYRTSYTYDGLGNITGTSLVLN